MYKYLIIGIALMFMAGGSYYINYAGGGIMSDIIAGKITTQDTLIPINIDEVPGIYVCATVSTCKSKYTLVLKNDKTVELTKSESLVQNPTSTMELNETEQRLSELDKEEDLKMNTEKGEWDLGIKNMLIVTITEKGEYVYDIPQKIVIQNVGTKTLSKISYTKTNYEDMKNPIFIKQD